MGRDTKTKCKKCRRARTKLFLKGEKCYTEKCPMEKRPYPPGESGGRRSRSSQYRVRLREKQKARHIYGLREEQFRNYVEEAKKGKTATGDRLLQILESRADNIMYRGGLAVSRDQARQLINHGHVAINGRSLNKASYLAREDDKIGFKDNARKKDGVKDIISQNADRSVPEWLDKNQENGNVSVLFDPDPDEMKESIKVNLIVEFYSR